MMKRTLGAALLAACLIPAAVFAQGATDADRWNLAEVYADEAVWKTDADKLEAQLKAFAGCKGQLGRSAARLRECLDLRADALKRLYRLYLYAQEKLSEDTGAAVGLSLSQRAELLGSAAQEATAFVEPELLRVGKARIDGFLKADKGLRIHAYPLAVTLRSAAHTLDDAGESLVAQFGLMSGSPQSTYGVLTGADLPWPKLKLSTGEEVTLDPSGYTKYREAPNRDDRKRVMDSFFGAYKQFERTLGVSLYSQMKEDAVFAKVRRYPDSISRAFDGLHTPVQVLDTLIAQTQAGLPTLHRYFKLRARLLGVPQLAYYDIYPPLVKSEFKFPLAVGKQMALDSAAPLGTEYVAAMKDGLANRWMDAYPRPRKQSGAHMNGAAYDVHPYVLMNYNDDYSSVTTLAHEWGHAMHSWLANRAQSFITADYPIFTAEIASTFNESLLLDHVLKNAKTDDERLLYLGHALENLRGTFFRQAMFAEFERTTHARVDGGESLTGEDYTKTYCDLLKRYHGAAQGVVAIDDAYCVEWAYIPHFYNSYYVYQYATSTAASSLFAQQVARGEPGALERYLGVLRAGGSQDPYMLVKNAGVDLASPAPYQALVARMNKIMDEIEALLAKRG
jgi:oligoendopeptidase F